ncbi:helix-turn-helix domain-containing protein [Enterocloster bolteae]|uniref:helix-turn-helix domain-containing protein n=1 Tax=Enterocloster bolteae TaxID=208479 RepID=UPI0009B6BFD2|nr:helix-turn-helix transcriptional regulator [Enterocloster bolteae]ASN94363.1 XRE family transcriptional regulator [Enterocloster bolteae]PQL54372.1 XRE family transcriptional regulator [Enterocloster bolteae]QRP40959.1 helix-turn-helix transcriptional regulator [Enterocloster bolteae]
MVKIHLSRLLGEKRWSQAKLARITGIRASTINDIYNEFSERISLEHLNRICRALDCDISDILEYIPDEPR